MLEKGAIRQSIQAGQPSVPSIKEGWKATTSSQLQGLAHIHTFETFQDVRAPSIK